MRISIRQSLYAAVTKLLQPLIRILLRNGIPYGTFADLAKRVYVDVAAGEFGIPGRKQSISRISIITGLSRKEVSRVSSLPEQRDDEAAERYNRAARVIGGWIRDRDFLDDQNRPAELRMEGPGPTFNELVRRFSGDVPARAVLDELLHVGAIERVGTHSVRLLQRAYLPKTDEAGMLDILGTDVKDLISTIDHNLRRGTRESFFQRKVTYDNLPAEIIQELRRLSESKGQTWLEEMNRWLAQHDRDVNPSAGGTGRKRAGMGIYYFEEDFQEGGESS
jgi:hypothetical protein